MRRKISIFDSTLRDGAQSVGISFSVEDKLAIVKQLDRLGVDFVEAGNPSSNPKELVFFEKVRSLPLKHTKVVAFGSTRRKHILASQDHNLQSLIDAKTNTCCIFGKSWKYHVDHVLETSGQENLNMIRESCEFLKKHEKHVVFDAEHFFDGFLDNPEYAISTLKAAVAGGADAVCLCDTNGGVFPWDVKRIVSDVCTQFSVPIAVHFHDDSGLAVANSIAGVCAGASQVQGTLLGFGERCGNANLSSIIPNLQSKMGFSCIPESALELLTPISREVAAVANIDIYKNMPYIGHNAFSHKAGMHADGVLKTPRSFEHINPHQIGNSRNFPASEISGKAIVLKKMQELMTDLQTTSTEAQEVLQDVKRLERIGYQFEGADASFELLARKRVAPFSPFFELTYYHIYTNFDATSEIGMQEDAQLNQNASAVVKVCVNGQIQLMVAEGNGPVHALDTALRKALEIFYPVISKGKLSDYKVRVLDSKNATASPVRVLITSSDGANTFTTVGVSHDVVAASWKALEDSMEYLLLKNK